MKNKLIRVLCILFVSYNFANAVIFTNELKPYGGFIKRYKTYGEYSNPIKRSLISINLMPGFSFVFPKAFNILVNKQDKILRFIGLTIPNDIKEYLSIMQIKSSGFYIPTFSYSLFITDRISIEVSAGFSKSEYAFFTTKDTIQNFFDKEIKKLIGEKNELPFMIDIATTDTFFNSRYTFLPITMGVRFYGKKKAVFHAIKVGINTFIYDITTLNGITGVQTKKSVIDSTVYVSYELGWQIELFPNRNWRVKPSIDFSLFEIGYYVRPWMPNVYSAASESIAAMTWGISTANNYTPNWSTFPTLAKYLSNIKLAILPRIGFSLRF